MIEKVRKFTGFRQGCLPDSGKQFCLICAKYGVAVIVTLSSKQGHTGGPMNERSPTEVIHGIIEEQEERDLILMSEEQTELQRKQEATQPDSVTSENYARVVADVP